MATRLEIAKNKLERLEKELETVTEQAFNHTRSTHGSPVNDKRGGASFNNRTNQIKDKGIRIYKELEAQKERVAYLQEKSEIDNTAEGQIKEMKRCIEKGNRGAVTLRKYKKKIIEMENTQNLLNNLTAKAEKIKNSGLVKKWEKNPAYFFVIGLRKVAIQINSEGNFEVSEKYPPKSDEEKNIVEKILMC